MGVEIDKGSEEARYNTTAIFKASFAVAVVILTVLGGQRRGMC